jgi:hypothetical protein
MSSSFYKTTTDLAPSFGSLRSDLSDNSRDVIIGDQWVVLGRIGEGSFGEVFEGKILHILNKHKTKRMCSRRY